MDENKNYTYTYKKIEKRQKNTIGILIAMLAIVFFAAAIIIGVAIGKKQAEEDVSVSESVQSAVMESQTAAPLQPAYKPGTYTVDTGGYTLLFRKEPKTDADAYLEISDKQVVEVDEIYVDEASTDENYKYWGRLDYLGYTGWVAMAYLSKEYSDAVVTPEDLTTQGPTTEVATVETSVYQTGEYTIDTGGYTLRFKDQPAAESVVLSNLPDGMVVNVIQVVEVEATEERYRYWGKIIYEGREGYVSMQYLRKHE